MAMPLQQFAGMKRARKVRPRWQDARNRTCPEVASALSAFSSSQKRVRLLQDALTGELTGQGFASATAGMLAFPFIANAQMVGSFLIENVSKEKFRIFFSRRPFLATGIAACSVARTEFLSAYGHSPQPRTEEIKNVCTY